MKKIFYIISLLMMCLFLNACTIGHRINKFEVLQLTIENLEYTDQAKINYFDENKDLVILDNDKFAKYDKNYFKEHSLIIITLRDNKDNVYNESGIKNGKIAIDRQVAIDSELTNWTLILEIEDKILDIENFIVSFIDSEKQIEHIHNYKESIIKPTCQEHGYANHKCECGEEYKDNYTEIVECEYKDGYCIWCKNVDLTNKYNISIHSEDLVETTVGLFYDGSSQMEGCGYKNISSLYYRFEKNQLNEFKYIDMTSEFDDYYTCCYFNSDKKNLLDSIKNIELVEFENAYYKQPWGAWSGINFYLARLNLYNYLQGGMNHEKSLINMDDIKWIEIPKNEIIPSEIDNFFLIAIAESKTVIETTIFGNEIKEYKWYFESKHLYVDGLVYPEYDEFYNDWINQKYLVDYCNFATLICNNVLNSFSGLHLLKYDSLRIQEIDGINYIRTSCDNTLWGEKDLIDILEYKKEVVDDYLSYYWLKYEDIIELLAGD